jgi:hypothetical protein
MKFTGKILRAVAIILLILTAAFNLLGGAGTTCAAFFTEKYPTLAVLASVKWLYQILVVTTIATGIAGIWATVGLIRGKEKYYRNTLIVLMVGTVLGGVQYYSSLALRGAAAPANVKFYLNAVTLIVFLVCGIPGIREWTDFEKQGGAGIRPAAGVATFIAGLLTLSTPMWAGPTHTYMGQNWVYLLGAPLNIAGSLLVLGSLAWLLKALLREARSLQVENV